jgi:hemoglobin
MHRQDPTAPRDLDGHPALEEFIVAFYNALLQDEEISYIFTEVVALDFAHHIPRIVGFWESILFQAPTYEGNPMEVHQRLNEKSPLSERHFEIWLRHFIETADAKFAGPNCELMKQRANSIATMMKIKVLKFNL